MLQCWRFQGGGGGFGVRAEFEVFQQKFGVSGLGFRA